MKYPAPYRFFLKSIVFMLLIGQIWVNMGSYGNWITETKYQPMEILANECASFSEEDIKQDLDEEFKIRLNIPVFGNLVYAEKLLSSEVFLLDHYPEITTPPPEVPEFLS